MKKILARLVGFYFNILVLFAPKTAGKRAFLLFSSPQRPILKSNHLEFFNTAHQFTFEFNGHNIQCYKWGTGSKVLVFIHGWQSHTFRWKNYIEAFSKEEFTIYAMDAPGQGLSGGKHCNIPLFSHAIEKFLTQIPPVHTLISHSLGSISVLYAFYRVPDLSVKQLIITGTPGEGADYVRYYEKMLGVSKRTSKAIRDAFVTYTGHLPEFFSSLRFAKAVTIPMLSIHDEGDAETPYHYAAAVHKALPHSKLITTTGFGHNLRSPEVVKYVFDFVMHNETEKAVGKTIEINSL
ncbi:MAG: alpha/beta hydrolase [Cyclobacteriaceae bacterium]|nr:alpha/beta hydrolase [Cyclobacteriaceae bacterium]